MTEEDRNTLPNEIGTGMSNCISNAYKIRIKNLQLMTDDGTTCPEMVSLATTGTVPQEPLQMYKPLNDKRASLMFILLPLVSRGYLNGHVRILCSAAGINVRLLILKPQLSMSIFKADSHTRSFFLHFWSCLTEPSLLGHNIDKMAAKWTKVYTLCGRRVKDKNMIVGTQQKCKKIENLYN